MLSSYGNTTGSGQHSVWPWTGRRYPVASAPRLSILCSSLLISPSPHSLLHQAHKGCDAHFEKASQDSLVDLIVWAARIGTCCKVAHQNPITLLRGAQVLIWVDAAHLWQGRQHCKLWQGGDGDLPHTPPHSSHISSETRICATHAVEWKGMCCLHREWRLQGGHKKLLCLVINGTTAQSVSRMGGCWKAEKKLGCVKLRLLAVQVKLDVV